MIVDTRQMTAEQCYRLMTGVIVPRPIAWVTTLSAAGVVNLAPFSHFTFVAPKPPLVALSFGRKGTHYKDTTHNILASEEFVVHIARSTQVVAVHDSAIDFPSDTSEVAELGLATLPSTEVKPPRLADTPIAMECRLRHCIELGESRNRLIIGEVILLHFADGILENGKIDSRNLDPLCRLAGPNYAALGEIMTMTPIGQRAKAST
jgi:flavin reductase (DIM6/NTAB) family NADH-FMN oxidoreductase RutF